jgi:hypothetical protein
MASAELDNLVRAQLLKREPGEQGEFYGLVASGEARLADVQKGLAPESQFDLAYNAAHALSLAALRWHGYRPNEKPYIVFAALQHTLGLGPEVWRVLDKAHGLRNLAEYEGRFDADARLIEDLFKATEVVSAALKKLGPVQK